MSRGCRSVARVASAASTAGPLVFFFGLGIRVQELWVSGLGFRVCREGLGFRGLWWWEWMGGFIISVCEVGAGRRGRGRLRG